MESTSFGDYNHGLQVGHSSGSIHAEIHLPPEPPEATPSPVSTVPFPRDPDFVSRNTLLYRIREKNSVPGSRIALVGLGGVGKSQLAIEYSYIVKSASPAIWVFWIHASNEARFEQSFRDIADRVKIPSRQDPRVNIFRLVENWLRDEKKGKWICILDNADDYKCLCSLPVVGKGILTRESMNVTTKPLMEYIPRNTHGSVIITSRSREVVLRMVHHQDLIEVRPMERSEAMELLERQLIQSGGKQESYQLVEALEFMPLAIVQAASFIRERGHCYSVSKYLRNFQESDRKATRLMQAEGPNLYRDWEANNSILMTWQISFDHIRQTKQSAAELLSLMSFFDRQGIPEKLIRLQSQPQSGLSSQLLDDFTDGDTSGSDTSSEFEDDIMVLRNFSFISIREKSSFMMHRLVQLGTHMWLKTHGKIHQWREKFISNLYRELPADEFDNWNTCQLIFPHIRSAVFQQPKSQESLLKWATLLYRGACYASESGNIADARKMASKSRKQRVQLLGIKNEETLASTAILARAYSIEGRWDEAEQLFVQVMEIYKTKLGMEKDPLNVLISMANLASTYRDQGRWETAEQLNLQVMEAFKTNLGLDHPRTLMIIGNLASTYKEQGRWNEAEQLFLQVIDKSKTKFGPGHPNTMICMANLASTISSQGRWKEAEQIEIQVMEAFKTGLGQDHPDTLMSMANLASTLRNQGRWNEAEQLFLQVIEKNKTKFGPDHPNTLICMANLASTISSQGRWEEAEQIEIQVVEARKTKLGMDHPSTLTSMANLASTLGSQGRWDEGERLCMQVMEKFMTNLGMDHPSTLRSMANLALIYRNQGHWEKAQQLFVQVVEARKNKLGMDHPDTLNSMANLAFTWKFSGRITRALDLLRECVTKQKQILGLNHHQTLFNSETLFAWEKEKLNRNT